MAKQSEVAVIGFESRTSYEFYVNDRRHRPLDIPLTMERQDGRDPLDPQTYYSENGLTITTMVELRVFCASFFEHHVRHNIDPLPERTMTKFIKLITASDFFFARARAVIPELQVPNTVSFHEDINICRILLETQRFRGQPGKKWSIHADESAWSKLSNDGRAMLERKASGQREQGGEVSASLVISSTSPLSL